MLTPQQTAVIKEVLAPFNPQRIGVFGSVARNENTPQSDIDILVHFNDRVSLFDLIDIEDKLYKALHQKVDVITERSLHVAVKEFIKEDIIYL